MMMEEGKGWGAFLVKRLSTGSGRPELVEGRLSLFRENRETCEKTVRGPKFEVSGTVNSKLRTSNFELRAAPVSPVSPVSLESGIGDCSRSVHE